MLVQNGHATYVICEKGALSQLNQTFHRGKSLSGGSGQRKTLAFFLSNINTGAIMIAREWKARCPMTQKAGFIKYLYQTGIKDSSGTIGFKGAQIFTRDLEENTEVTLISYWDSLNAIKAFAGDNIEIARLYQDDYKYELEPDTFVSHYEVIENQWV